MLIAIVVIVALWLTGSRIGYCLTTAGSEFEDIGYKASFVVFSPVILPVAFWVYLQIWRAESRGGVRHKASKAMA